MKFDVRRVLCCTLLIAIAPMAHAEMKSASVQIDHTDYDGAYGDRAIFGVTATGRAGGVLWQADLAQGRRDYADIDHSGKRARGSLHYDWSKWLSTRTAATVASDSPVFVTREIGHDFKLKLVRNAVINVGGRYAEYYNNVYVSGFSVGAEYYLPRVTTIYRYNRHHVSTGGSGHGNTLMLRLKDTQGRGSSQLWIGEGNAAYYTDADPLLLRDHRSKSVLFRRNQPLGETFMLTAGLGKTWHETKFDTFGSITGHVGLGYAW